MQLKNVVLPAPLGPMTLTIIPCVEREVERLDGEQAAESLGRRLDLEQGHQDRLGDRWSRPADASMADASVRASPGGRCGTG